MSGYTALTDKEIEEVMNYAIGNMGDHYPAIYRLAAEHAAMRSSVDTELLEMAVNNDASVDYVKKMGWVRS